MRWLGYALLALLALAAAYILLLAVAALAVDPGREYPSESRFYRRLLDGLPLRQQGEVAHRGAGDAAGGAVFAGEQSPLEL